MSRVEPSTASSDSLSPVDLPAPRLQLRWEANTGKQRFAKDDAWLSEVLHRKINPTPEWLCYYELVIPLSEYDIRREVYGPRGGRRKPDRTELVIPMKKPTVRASQAIPCVVTNTGERWADDPVRDGPHAIWDAKLLGDLPIFVIGLDGMAFPLIREEPTS